MLFKSVFPLLGLAAAAAAYSQQPLGVGYDVTAQDVSAMTAAQREQLMLELWKGFDVVEIMHLTGHGDGLDEERLVHVFGEDEPRRCVIQQQTRVFGSHVATRMTEGDKLRLKQQGLEFMDITEHPTLGALNAQRPQRFVNPEPKLLAQSSDAVRALLAGEITTDHMRADITKLSSFWTRSYRSNWGLLSSNWVYDHVSSVRPLLTKHVFASLADAIPPSDHRREPLGQDPYLDYQVPAQVRAKLGRLAAGRDG